MKKNLGFTMIEVMIVIVIIGLMASLGGSAYSKSLQKGRDTKRVSDMQEIQKGFEMYYSTNQDTPYAYKVNCTGMIAGIPKDPDGSVYPGTCTATTYYYCAELERPQDFGNATFDGTTVNFVAKASSSHYCVINVQ
jgi:prepilin-type N-terminal cleavage/methylation domain-containing protein